MDVPQGDVPQGDPQGDPSNVVIEKPTLFPSSFISRVKKPVIGFSMRRITFSIRVDLPHRGGPVTRIFFDVI